MVNFSNKAYSLGVMGISLGVHALTNFLYEELLHYVSYEKITQTKKAEE